jgi:hypothetical protein
MADNIGAEIIYNRRFNLGPYIHEDITLKITGPYDVLTGPESEKLISNLTQTVTRSGVTVYTAHLQLRGWEKSLVEPKNGPAV